jgi:hypothetical protein
MGPATHPMGQFDVLAPQDAGPTHTVGRFGPSDPDHAGLTHRAHQGCRIGWRLAELTHLVGFVAAVRGHRPARPLPRALPRAATAPGALGWACSSAGIGDLESDLSHHAGEDTRGRGRSGPCAVQTLSGLDPRTTWATRATCQDGTFSLGQHT